MSFERSLSSFARKSVGVLGTTCACKLVLSFAWMPKFSKCGGGLSRGDDFVSWPWWRGRLASVAWLSQPCSRTFCGPVFDGVTCRLARALSASGVARRRERSEAGEARAGTWSLRANNHEQTCNGRAWGAASWVGARSCALLDGQGGCPYVGTLALSGMRVGTFR